MKYKYLISFNYKPRDRWGNVYSYVIVTCPRTGRSISSSDVPESNARLIAFYLNGKEHVQNYYWTETLHDSRQFNYLSPAYLSSCPETLAKAFMKELRRRKPRA